MANGWLGLPVTDLPPGSEHGIIRHWKEGLLDGAPGRGLSPSRQATYSNHLTIGTNVLECICYASAMFAPPMASPRLILLNHPESLRPARLPRLCRGPSRGLCRGAFRDPARNVALLTPSISLRLIQALSYTQITRETPRIPFFFFNSLRTLSFSVSCKSCVCHSYANRRGCGPTIPNLERVSRRSQPHSSSLFSYPSGLFCALAKLNSFLFMHFRTLWAKHPGWGWGSSGIPKEELELFPHLKRDQRLAQGCGTMVPAGNLARSNSSPKLLVVSLPFTSWSPDRTARKSALPVSCRSWARLRLSSTRTPSRSFPRPFC